MALQFQADHRGWQSVIDAARNQEQELILLNHVRFGNKK